MEYTQIIEKIKSLEDKSEENIAVELLKIADELNIKISTELSDIIEDQLFGGITEEEKEKFMKENNLSETEFRKNIKAQAKNISKINILTNLIFIKEGFNIDNEVEEKVNELLEEKKDLNQEEIENFKAYLRDNLMKRKVFEFLKTL